MNFSSDNWAGAAPQIIDALAREAGHYGGAYGTSDSDAHDIYVEFGKRRLQPTSRDLHDVLTAVSEGRDLEARATTAIGCYIADLK